jgi:hypothetical protein
MKKRGRNEQQRTEEDRAFEKLWFELGRGHAVIATLEYEHRGDPRFAWLAYKSWRMLQRHPDHAQFGIEDRLPQSLVEYLDAVAERIAALDGGDLGRSLIAALGFKQGSKGKTGRWSVRATEEALYRDLELALEIHRLINGDFRGKTDAAAREVADKKLRKYRAHRGNAQKQLEALPEEARRRALEVLAVDHPMRSAKNLKELRVEFDRQIAEYKRTLPSPSTVLRAYRRIFRNSPIR